ncbi:MAG: DNA-3-methyladenine glycosylase [Nitrososphaeraceae archaeon]
MNHSFYAQPTQDVAKKLIGKKLVRMLSGNSPHILSGIIVEAEAYGSADDEASHAFRGIGVRNSMMFGDVGRVYVYLSYGTHFCFNITAHSTDHPAGAVLIRGIQPLEGLSIMMRFRATDDPFLVASGPGRLTQALNIGMNDNGIDVTVPNSIIVKNGIIPPAVLVSSRVGISKATNKQWRYVFAHWDHHMNLPSSSRYASKWRQTYSAVYRNS